MDELRSSRSKYGAYGLDTADDTPDWRERAVCPSVDPELFFPSIEQYRGKPDSEARSYVKAQTVCRRCPVWRECREWAIENDERHGMWGGLTPRQIRRERNRRAAAA